MFNNEAYVADEVKINVEITDSKNIDEQKCDKTNQDDEDSECSEDEEDEDNSTDSKIASLVLSFRSKIKNLKNKVILTKTTLKTLKFSQIT